jgi:hypothetical protein
VKRRRYAAGRLARAAAHSLEAQRLDRVWRQGLARRLRRRLRAEVEVEIHDNTHTMVSFARLPGGWRLRLHHMFLGAPEEVVGALADYLRSGGERSPGVIDRFIEGNRTAIRRVSAEQLRRRLRIEPVGRHHDLSEIFAALNRRYFGDRIGAAITYGSAPRRRRARRSIKMGSYSAESRVIRIHPALDQARVPRYFVEWIVFHEMLHDLYRGRAGRVGRRCLHPPELLEHERRFHTFHRAQAWEQENLDLLLTARPGENGLPASP